MLDEITNPLFQMIVDVSMKNAHLIGLCFMAWLGLYVIKSSKEWVADSGESDDERAKRHRAGDRAVRDLDRQVRRDRAEAQADDWRGRMYDKDTWDF